MTPPLLQGKPHATAVSALEAERVETSASLGVEQRVWTPGAGWRPQAAKLPEAQLVLVFAGRDAMTSPMLEGLARSYPSAVVAGCSTAGEIAGTECLDGSIVATAIRFRHTRVRAAHIDVAPGEDAQVAGRRLIGLLPTPDLAHVLVFSDGSRVNGSALVQGLLSALPPGVKATGGLAGDGARFQSTLTFVAGEAREGRIVAVGFYGKRLKVGFGSLGGWDSFGPARLVTSAKGNILYELDGKPALALYKKYLGEHVKGLPATGLLFPLSVQVPETKTAAGAPAAKAEARGEVVRTILAINEDDQSLTFAGDIPQGSMARLMRANFDRLVDGAQGAAQSSRDTLGGRQPDFALLISCVGRKLVLKDRTAEELDAVRHVLGSDAVLSGFYSYGEICPAAPDANCELHNQTMTITTFREE